MVKVLPPARLALRLASVSAACARVVSVEMAVLQSRFRSVARDHFRTDRTSQSELEIFRTAGFGGDLCAQCCFRRFCTVGLCHGSVGACDIAQESQFLHVAGVSMN